MSNVYEKMYKKREKKMHKYIGTKKQKLRSSVRMNFINLDILYLIHEQNP
jgi:hypothetical protein